MSVGRIPASSRLRWLIGALVAAHILTTAGMIAGLPGDVGGHFVAADGLRYSQIATAPGMPYVAHEVEVPPIEVAYLMAIGDTDPHTTVVRNAIVQLLLDLVIAWGVSLGWGAIAAAATLGFSLALAPFLAFRLDLLSVAFAVFGLALARREMPRAGGILLGLGIMTKLWPAGIAIALVSARRIRTLGWMIGSTLAMTVAWVAIAPEGPLQVLSFRRAAGWQIESTLGAILLASTDDPVVFEAGANRVGQMAAIPRGFGVLVLLGLVITFGVLGRRALDAHDSGSPLDALVVAGVTAALLVCAPILSWQYISWLLPWLGIAAASRRWAVTLIGAVVVGLTTWLLFLGVELTAREPVAIGVVLARNAALIALVVALLVALARSRGAGNVDAVAGETLAP